MGRIFCIMGKSASGKDTIFRLLMRKKTLGLKRIVPYTTRPKRAGEHEGEEYHFVSRERMEQMLREGQIIERRTYHTHEGDWDYFTADDGDLDPDSFDYLMIATPEAFIRLREYFGKERTVPIYIEVEDGERLARALDRERSQQAPKYAEMCRRFLADERDFAPSLLGQCQIKDGFYNNDAASTAQQIAAYIQGIRAEDS